MRPKQKKMRPKQVADFRPIANIRLFYKVFACLVLDRIEHQLDDHQPEEQHCFRRGKRIEEHLLTANVFLDKALDVGIPVWVVILDLSKAFDQDVPPCYCTLLWTLYKGQTGSVHGSERFNIERGVKQGDVISPTAGYIKGLLCEQVDFVWQKCFPELSYKIFWFCGDFGGPFWSWSTEIIQIWTSKTWCALP